MNACVLRRPLPPLRIKALESACGDAIFERRDVIKKGSAPALELTCDLEDGPARAWLQADIARWVERYFALVPARRVEVSLELVVQDACRRYHQDNVGVRMLCTYFGPGTEWAPRSALQFPNAGEDHMPRDHDGIPVHLKRMRQTKPGDVVLLKGKRWPGVRQAAVHRSPRIEALGLRRLVLRIDAATTDS